MRGAAGVIESHLAERLASDAATTASASTPLATMARTPATSTASIGFSDPFDRYAHPRWVTEHLGPGVGARHPMSLRLDSVTRKFFLRRAVRLLSGDLEGRLVGREDLPALVLHAAPESNRAL